MFTNRGASKTNSSIGRGVWGVSLREPLRGRRTWSPTGACSTASSVRSGNCSRMPSSGGSAGSGAGREASGSTKAREGRRKRFFWVWGTEEVSWEEIFRNSRSPQLGQGCLRNPQYLHGFPGSLQLNRFLACRSVWPKLYGCPLFSPLFSETARVNTRLENGDRLQFRVLG